MLPRKRSALIFAAASCAICFPALAQQPAAAASSAVSAASHSAAAPMPLPPGAPMPPSVPHAAPPASQAASPVAAAPALRPTGSTAQAAARHEPAPREVKAAKARPSAGCPSSMEPAEQIACLQALNATLKAQIEHKELADKLAAKTDTRGLGLPSVLATYGVGSARKATLAWPGSSGGALVASVGDRIPGGYTVAEIGSGKVVLQSGSSRSTLLLSGGIASDAQTGSGGFAAGMPAPAQQSSANPYSAPPMPGFGATRPAPGAGG